MKMGCLLLAALACNYGVQASPVKSPQRMVSGQTVNLAPLFGWWSKHDGERPLQAWVHLTGSVVGTNAWCWILEASIEDSPTRISGPAERPTRGRQQKIILKNPPALESAEFQRLIAQRNALAAERQRLSAQITQAADQVQELSAQQKANRKHGVRSSRALSQQQSNWRRTEKEAKEKLKPIETQLKETKEKLTAFPDPENYTVDCFAFNTGETKRPPALRPRHRAQVRFTHQYGPCLKPPSDAGSPHSSG